VLVARRKQDRTPTVRSDAAGKQAVVDAAQAAEAAPWLSENEDNTAV
jgi:hypothetical protein